MAPNDCVKSKGTITRLHTWRSIWLPPHSVNTEVISRPNSPFKIPCVLVKVYLKLQRLSSTRGLSQGLTFISVCKNQISLKLLHLPFNSMREIDSHIWMLQESLPLRIDSVILFESKALLSILTVRLGSQSRPQLSAASPTNRSQPKVFITINKLKLWPAAGCEAKVTAELSFCP